MKNFIKLICSILLILQLAACATRTHVEQFKDVKGFNERRKGIVIIQTAQKVDKVRDKYNLKTTWKNKENKRIFTTDPENIIGELVTVFSIVIPSATFNFPTLVYFIEPGEYSLSSIYFDRRYANSLKDIITFSLKGGEVVYIGKLIVDDNNSRIVANALNIEDSYETAKKYFEAKYPEIKQTPIKRLMEFSEKAKGLRLISNEYGFIE
ncbi:hypothetical protein NF27_CL00050 [Candidatus Jidaibacter acanthamoeba]|uniref:Lipoprotein n=1 Tax=Candidatus Jidaibacter acanthamoebae TaxID=86105 RepID=A0A0C1N0G8_9RICK|nr:hypothetical protein [Candidatus Jidaibacter acanthamoeba]KIE05806.1 hypothetical protein NF27_CL00050 [Candidatus Jidaibacter acanthamoeba]